MDKLSMSTSQLHSQAEVIALSPATPLSTAVSSASRKRKITPSPEASASKKCFLVSPPGFGCPTGVVLVSIFHLFSPRPRNSFHPAQQLSVSPASSQIFLLSMHRLTLFILFMKMEDQLSKRPMHTQTLSME